MLKGRVYHLKLTYEQYQKRSKSIQNSIIDKYVIYEHIKSGNFGAVYRGMNNQTKKIVAVKVMDLNAIEGEKSQRVKEIKKRLAKSQSELMMQCDSPYVVKCYDVYENKSLKIMVIEYCNGGTLQQEIDKKGKIEEKEAFAILKQIINGLAVQNSITQHMHESKIIHRDLKAENILSHNGIYKIADLGFAKVMQIQDDQLVQGTILGTVTTMAPEIVRRQPYGFKADIWSIGVVLYQLLLGKVPFRATNVKSMAKEMSQKYMFQKHNINLSKQSSKFLFQLLEFDVKKRLGWKQLVSHKMLNQQYGFTDNFRITPTVPKVPEICDNLIMTQQQQMKVQDDIVNNRNMNIKPCEITQLSKDMIQNKIKEIKEDQDKDFQFTNQIHLQCLKTEYIFKKLVQPLQNTKYKLKDQQTKIEFIYLLLTRCLMNMTPIRQRLKISQNSQALLALQKMVKQLYATVSKEWNTYGDMLTAKQNEIGSIIIYKIGQLVSKKETEKKNLFLSGFENKQYTKMQQIQFTYQKYIIIIIDQVYKISKQIYNVLYNYREICNISSQRLKQKEKGFQEYVKILLV